MLNRNEGTLGVQQHKYQNQKGLHNGAQSLHSLECGCSLHVFSQSFFCMLSLRLSRASVLSAVSAGDLDDAPLLFKLIGDA